MKRILLLIVIAGFFILRAQAQQVAVKTNALMWGLMSPNLGCELVTGERTSVELSVFGNYKPFGKDMKMIGVQPEYRYWFNGRPMTREYIGIAALGVSYDITWKGHVYNGDAAGIGLTMGYSLNIKKRFNIEFYGGFGAIYFRQKQYYAGDNFEDFESNSEKRANAYGYKLLPIKLGVSLSYIIK